MGSGHHGGFGNTKGRRKGGLLPMNLQFFASKAFEKGGHVSRNSITAHAEYFLGKSARKLAKALQQQGYKTHIEHSIHVKSKAKKVVIENNSKTKNITFVLVSPGSKRHGETAYVRISTHDIGKYKIVADKSKYKSDGKERAIIIFARRKKNE